MPSKALDEKKRSKYTKTFNKLAWAILEMKFLYYEGAKYGLRDMAPQDEEYDDLENKYKKLAKKLGLEPTACNHVGFPNTPSARLVKEFMIKQKGKTKIQFNFKRKK